jgi:hypothetical protein
MGGMRSTLATRDLREVADADDVVDLDVLAFLLVLFSWREVSLETDPFPEEEEDGDANLRMRSRRLNLLLPVVDVVDSIGILDAAAVMESAKLSALPIGPCDIVAFRRRLTPISHSGLFLLDFE